MKLLEELYSFKPPSNNTEEALEHCQQQRALQLKELEACLKNVWDGTELTCEVDMNRCVEQGCKVPSFQLSSSFFFFFFFFFFFDFGG